MANEDDSNTARAVAEASAIAKLAAATATQTASAIAVVDRKVDTVLQETGYIKSEQIRSSAVMASHITADAVAFDKIDDGQNEIKLKVALLAQENINDSRGFSVNWGTIASVITMLLAALIAYLLRGS